MVLPDSIVTVSLMLPLPYTTLFRSELAVLVKVSLVKMPGKVSPTVAPVTVLGPLLLRSEERRAGEAAVTESVPSVLVIDRSLVADRVSGSVAVWVAVLLSGQPLGGVTVAVLTRLPLAVGETVPVTV